MQHNRHSIWLISLVSFVVLLSTVRAANAQELQEHPTFSKDDVERARNENPLQAKAPALLGCRGPITQVIDVGFEGVKITSAVFGTNPGGGEGGQFDKTPVLSTNVTLNQGVCLDAHLSAIVGSQQTYKFVSRMTLFQVTLTRLAPPPIAGPRHMFGHYETPFGRPAPAVALEAERDVDMYASNFFQKVGSGPHEVPPGNYRVDVWWAGGPWFNPPPPGGAIGAAFVLKLYLR
jgi:hypothetical protein